VKGRGFAWAGRTTAVALPGVGNLVPPEPVPEGYRSQGRARVAAGGADRPVGYLIGEPVAGALHSEQVSVHPDFARRRIGGALLAYAAELGLDRWPRVCMRGA
jgi:hypothetical protein